MIRREYLGGLGLTEDQTASVMDILGNQIRFIKLLEREKVSNISAALRVTDIAEVDFDDEELLREKIRIEFSDLIPKQNKNVQIWASKK